VRRIVTADIGGTHARFAFAEIEADRVRGLSDPVTLRTAEHASFHAAWEEFGRRSGEPLPDELAISFAGPVNGELLKLTNSSWVIRPALLIDELGVARITIVNDFGAVGHAVAALDHSAFVHLCGPDRPLTAEGVITILGPGTGLGVAALLRRGTRREIIETEGGHIDFAPLDAVEDRILVGLRRSFGRVSVERLLSGRGLVNIYEALASIENRPADIHDERALWTVALEGGDSLAEAALDRFCLTLGAVAGDLALAQGACAVVIGGGLGLRLAAHLPRSGFRDRFIAKGRFEQRLDAMPVKIIAHPQPGLFGAAAAFAAEHA
jgi:glucokinase